MSKRTDIVDALLTHLGTLQRDQLVGASATVRYTNTPGLVTIGEVEADALDMAEFPAIQVIPDLPTVFEEGASGESYLAEWRIALKLFVRANETNITHGENSTWRRLEEFYQDVEYAIHDGDFQFSIGPDVSFQIESFDPVAPADEIIGVGAIVLKVNYVTVVTPD